MAGVEELDPAPLPEPRHLPSERYGTATPMWFVAERGTLYIMTGGDSDKRRRRSPRARVAPYDARGRLRGEWREARALLVSDPRVIDRAHAALRSKYGWQMWLAEALACLRGRLHRGAWIEIEL